jgi:hypothetical protein
VGWEKAITDAPPNSRVLFSRGYYATSTGIKLTKPLSIEGAGARGTQIIALRDMPYVFGTDSLIRMFSFMNLVVDANYHANSAFVLTNGTDFDVPTLKNVFVSHAKGTGIVLRACQLCSIEAVLSTGNGDSGISFEGCNATAAVNISTTFNRGDGIVVRKAEFESTVFSGSMSFFNIDSEGNRGHEVSVLDTTTPVTFVGGWLESGAPGKDGFHISAPHVTILGMRISGQNLGGVGYAINLLPGAEGADIRGVTLLSEAGHFAQIHVHPSIQSGHFEPSVGEVIR